MGRMITSTYSFLIPPKVAVSALVNSLKAEEIALANKIAGKQPTNLATWAHAHFPVLTT